MQSTHCAGKRREGVSDARDVIAGECSAIRADSGYKPHSLDDVNGDADEIIAALHAAGYAIAPPGSVVVSGEMLHDIRESLRTYGSVNDYRLRIELDAILDEPDSATPGASE